MSTEPRLASLGDIADRAIQSVHRVATDNLLPEESCVSVPTPCQVDNGPGLAFFHYDSIIDHTEGELCAIQPSVATKVVQVSPSYRLKPLLVPTQRCPVTAWKIE